MNERTDVALDVRDVERELCRLPDISAVRIVSDHSGRPIEVHVLALPGKRPKQIVRDVQSVALASFGLEIDRRVVSVVQLGIEGTTHSATALPVTVEHVEPAETGRPRIVSINAELAGLRALVRVKLAFAGEVRVGHAEGSMASVSRHRLIAAATIDAIHQLVPAADCLDIESAQIVRLGAHDIALVALVLVAPPIEQIVSGSAVVRDPQDAADAVARAVLDATNRPLAVAH